MNAWNPQANDLFLRALALPAAHERQEYIDGACQDDADLRAEVEALLAAAQQAGSFLESPAVASAVLATVGPPIAERPGTMIGSYKLLEQIGEGGFGIVFMAEQQQLLGGGGGWLLGERAAQEQRVTSERLKREAALDKEVDRALEEADSLRAQEKWPEALAAVERGDQLLASAGRNKRPARLLDLHKELKFASRLEDIHRGAQGQRTSLPAARGVDEIAGDPGPRLSAEAEFFWGRDQDRQFAREFRDFGIDIDALARAEAAEQLLWREAEALIGIADEKRIKWPEPGPD